MKGGNGEIKRAGAAPGAGLRHQPMLAETEAEALSLAVAGRRPELLKETKVFDSERIVAGELFAGRGGAQMDLFSGGDHVENE